MARRLTAAPFAYRPGKSVFHRCGAGFKLLGLIAFSALAFASRQGLALSALLLAVLCLAARIPPGGLLRGSRPLALLALTIVLVKTVAPGSSGIVTPEIAVAAFSVPPLHVPLINPEGFLEGATVAFRIFVVFAAAGFLFAVTTMRELRLSLAALENRAKAFFFSRRGKKAGGGIAFFSLGVSLMLGFIPRFFETWETANLACRSRSCRGRFRRLFVSVPLATERMMEAAAETVLALEARGLGAGEGEGE